MSVTTLETTLQTELAELRQELVALRRELAQRLHVSLNAETGQRFLGQPRTVTAVVSHGPNGSPAVGVPVTLVTSWGRLMAQEGAERGLAGSVSGLTGLDGTLRAELLPATAEDMPPHQRELLAGALGLLDGSGTPGDAEAGLRSLARMYRQSGSRELRQAVDLLFRDFGARARAGVEQGSLPARAWPGYDAVVMAYAREGDLSSATSGVLASAIIDARFDDWLGAWLQAYLQLASSEDRIAQDLQNARARGEPARPMLDVIYTRLRSMVNSHPGSAGEFAAQRLAAQAMRAFVLSSNEVPLEVQTQLFPAMNTASAAMATGASAFETLSRVRADLNDERLDARLDTIDPGKIRDVATQLGDLRGQLATKIDQAVLQAALGGKVDTAAFNQAIAGKADQAALATKVDTAAFNQAIAGKIDQSTLQAALASKADQSALQGKVDTATFSQALASKADQSALVGKVDTATLNQALAGKADRSALEKKVDTATFDQTLAGKADQAALEKKVDVSRFDQALSAKVDRATFDTELQVQVTGRVDELLERNLPRRLDRALEVFRGNLDRDLNIQFEKLRDEFRRP